jgi:hypothetical protein
VEDKLIIEKSIVLATTLRQRNDQASRTREQRLAERETAPQRSPKLKKKHRAASKDAT